MRCGDCRWFDGDGWLDDRGHGSGMCNLEPPVWVGPSAVLDYDAFLEWVTGDGWQRPMVGVAAKPCRHFECELTVNINTGLE